MLKSKKLIFTIVAAMALIAGLTGSASAADLNWTANTTVTINSNNYTIQSDSAATSMVVGATTLTVVVPSGSTFTLISSNKYLLNNNQSISQVCSDTQNSLSIAGSAATVVITPDATSTCVASSSRPSGGGGGDSTPPGDATNVTAAVSAGKVVLSWTKPTDSDFSSIRIYRSTVSGTRGSQIASSLTGTSYIDTSVTNGTTYYYTIHAVDTSGNENTSATQISAIPGTPTSTPTPTPAPTPTPTTGPATPAAPSGVTLYRVAGEHRVYVIKDKKKQWIKTAEEFSAAGYDWSDISEVAASALAAYPDVSAALIRAIGDSKVYVVENGKKRWIKTAEEFSAAGYDWSAISEVAASALSAYPEAGAAIVKIINTSTLRVRQSNTTRSSILGNVKRNETYAALEEKNGWYKITTKTGTTGWISGAYAAKQ